VFNADAENFVCRLSWSVFRHFVAIHSWDVCSSQKLRKIHSKPFLGVQGRSKSSMLVYIKSLSTVLVMISSMFVLIGNRFHTKRANSGKITCFWRVGLGWYLFWRPRSRGPSAPRNTKFCHEKLESLRQPTVKISWFQLALFWYSATVWPTDERTHRQSARRWLRRAKHSAIARKN